ncbi:sodium/hydrogen exchanger 9B2-like [Clavelina lepadiformis]|uniref:sodium/hydrogen exchanger 9B2-like n=1 Tax=Clavelina lepadiformis TaxID=159417 RepID=UPI0040421935
MDMSKSTSFERRDSGIEIKTPRRQSLDRRSSDSFSSMSCGLDQTKHMTKFSASSPKTWKQILWPPRGLFAKYVTWTVVLAALFGGLWSLMPEEMSPDHDVFDLVLTVIFCFAAEQIVIKIPMPDGFPPLPPLLASLLMGLMLRNLPAPANIAYGINPDVSATLRKLSLTVILTRAGLEIDPEGMKKVKWAVIRLAFTPCIIETVCIGVLGHFILGFPWVWSFMTGFVIAAVSPAVVVPCLCILQAKGYGVAKGIPSLVMAASGIDDVLAITGFTILLGIAIPAGLEHDIIDVIVGWFEPSPPPTTTTMSMTTVSYENATMVSLGNSTHGEHSTVTSNIGKQIGAAAIEVVIGIIAGLVLGWLISHFPPRKMKFKNFCRGFLLLSIGILFVFGSTEWDIPGAGTLCAIIMSFTASLHWKEETAPLAKAWHYMWLIFQPILFGLTGTLVDVKEMDGRTVGLGLAVLGCALIVRLITSTSVTFGLKFNLREKLFVSIAWIPKGTVQAALCSTAWEEAKAQNRPPEEIEWGREILVLAVLITLITAPLGAFGIGLSGPKLLNRSEMGNPHTNEAYIEDDEEEDDDDIEHSPDQIDNSSDSERSCRKSESLPGLQVIVTDPTLDAIGQDLKPDSLCFERETTKL